MLITSLTLYSLMQKQEQVVDPLTKTICWPCLFRRKMRLSVTKTGSGRTSKRNILEIQRD